jgi:hypothetical protein
MQYQTSSPDPMCVFGDVPCFAFWVHNPIAIIQGRPVCAGFGDATSVSARNNHSCAGTDALNQFSLNSMLPLNMKSGKLPKDSGATSDKLRLDGTIARCRPTS